MKKIVIACQKGGVGKSTLALNLLIVAISRGMSAAIHDVDDQASCMFMAEQRARLHKQRLPVFTEPPPDVDLLIVDTPPHANAALPSMLSGADLLLVPTRPATLDLAAASGTLVVARTTGIKHAVVLMLPTARSPEIEESKAWLASQNTDLAGIVHNRIDVARSAGQGRGMLEFDCDHPATREFTWIADYAFKAIA